MTYVWAVAAIVCATIGASIVVDDKDVELPGRVAAGVFFGGLTALFVWLAVGA